MPTSLVGDVERVIVAHLEVGEDLLEAIETIARDNDIRSGVVLSITGALARARLQHFKEGAIEVVEVEGPLEASGHGIIGKVRAPQYGTTTIGVAPLVHDGPYVHVHMTVSSESETICGHLMPGSPVWARHAVSHFTIMVARFSGVALYMAASGDPERADRGFGLHHVVEPS